jgi:hypothetical protein
MTNEEAKAWKAFLDGEHPHHEKWTPDRSSWPLGVNHTKGEPA